MPAENRSVKIRVRSGESEAEVEAAFSDIHEAIDLIPEVLSKLPPPGAAPTPVSSRSLRNAAALQPAGVNHIPDEEGSPALEPAVEEEEQLDLDAPAAN